MSLANVLQSFWPFHGPPDGRSARQIDDDLDAEFAFHLEQAQRDLVTQGHDRDVARELSHARFGNVDRIKRECLSIALKERTMLQRVNFIMMIVVLLMVMAVGVQVLITQRHNTLALQAITAEITNMKYDALASEPDLSAGAQRGGVIYISGDVVRTGTYNMPMSGTLTLRRAITAAGGVPDNGDAKVTVSVIDRHGSSVVRFKTDSIKGDKADFILQPDDHVEVKRIYAQADQPRLPQVGKWVRLDVSDNEIGDCKLEVIPHTDLRYLQVIQGRNDPIGVLQCGDRTLHLGFWTSLHLTIKEPRNVQPVQGPAWQESGGRWTWEGDDLMLNVDAVMPDAGPLRFRFVKTE